MARSRTVVRAGVWFVRGEARKKQTPDSSCTTLCRPPSRTGSHGKTKRRLDPPGIGGKLWRLSSRVTFAAHTGLILASCYLKAGINPARWGRSSASTEHIVSLREIARRRGRIRNPRKSMCLDTTVQNSRRRQQPNMACAYVRGCQARSPLSLTVIVQWLMSIIRGTQSSLVGTTGILTQLAQA